MGVTEQYTARALGDGWKPGEEPLRREEVASQRRSTRYQLAAVIAGALTATAALIAAGQAVTAVRIAQEGIQRQADESRVSTAIDAIGADQVAQRVAGFSMLRRHVETVMQRAIADGTEETADDAMNLYDMSLDMFENYIKNPVSPKASKPSSRNDEAGLGYGTPDVPTDVVYAANELHELLEHPGDVRVLSRDGNLPAVDLASAQLYRKSWAEIDLSWLASKYMPNIDLRGANLSDSQWGTAYLGGAHLQCANLAGASFEGATLTDVDFRGSNLDGTNLQGTDLEDADFRGANMVGVKLFGARNKDLAIGLKQSASGAPAGWRLEDCLDKRNYHMKEDAEA